VSNPALPKPVRLDPDSPDDCAALSDALFAETGVEIDPEAIADALRTMLDTK
jgi:hypothetical protein